MAAYYWKVPSAEDRPAHRQDSDYGDPPDIVLWDEHWDVFHLFMRYATQWRAGPAGIIGLDMTVFHTALDRKGITGSEFDEYVDNLRIIEAAAVQELHKK